MIGQRGAFDDRQPGKEVGGMFFQKKKPEKTEIRTYDTINEKPVLKCSICNGEQVAGFKDIRTGKFEEVTLIRNEKELEAFMRTYGIDEIFKEY